MLFSSIPFLYYFLPITLILYYAAPKSVKNVVLLLASLVFYGWGEPAFVFLMAASIVMGYIAGILIETSKHQIFRKIVFIISMIISFGLLAYFKYANFFIENFNHATGMGIPLLKVVLPIGISFYTFQLASYVIDVYRGNVKAQKNLISLATYITMFPQLIAGPIVRYSDVVEHLKERTHGFDKISYGIRRFVIGLSKKILIANVLGELCSIFKGSDEKSLLFYWMYAIAISLHIYFDFSGYSDMAIGLGSMLGFHFPENFNYPFISRSVTEFWRRWHMSLGTWFRDYVYIPLGGSRFGKYRTLLNIFIVWVLTGFWHGAEWTFVAWGLYFAILLIVEKLLLLKVLEKYKVLGHLYMLFVGVFGFVIFDAVSLTAAFETIRNMLGMGGLAIISAPAVYYLRSFGVILFMAIIGATPFPKKSIEWIVSKPIGGKIIGVIEPVIMIVLLLICTAYLVDGSFNPFLYFRF